MTDRPWLGVTPSADPARFAREMHHAVTYALCGGFDANLWGVAIEADHEERSVDVHFHFEREPSSLDRFEMGEFYDRLAEETHDQVVVRHHRSVDARAGFRRDRSEGRVWVYLTRDPAAVAPDDAEPEELDY